MTKMLEGKNAVITGGFRGIGKAMVEIFAVNGADIWLCSRKMGPKDELFINGLENATGVSVIFVPIDLEDENSVKEAAKTIRGYKKNIDVIVNNAGVVGENRSFSMTTPEELKRVFEINFFAPVTFTQQLVKSMIKAKSGSIINISSDAALYGRPSPFSYISSKAAIIGATRKMAYELGNYGIRVNAIAPGVTETGMIDVMADEIKEQTLANNAFGRLGKPEEIADAAVFLASDLSRYITGQVIRVDGGGN